MECFPVALDNQAGNVSGPWPFGPSQVIQLHLSKLVEGVGGRCTGMGVVTKLWQGDRRCFSLKTPNRGINGGEEWSGSWGKEWVFVIIPSRPPALHVQPPLVKTPGHPCCLRQPEPAPLPAPGRRALGGHPGVKPGPGNGASDGIGPGGSCIIWTNHGEITLIAYSIEVVNQNQQLCHCHFPRTQNFRKKMNFTRLQGQEHRSW